ncbi:MAG TPA: 16S rRNA (guanine(527)-N(7))-methyltransferase RsmG, partial [Blastocatellia bacterium]
MKTFRELLVAEFSPYGTLSVEQLAQLERHYELLLRWNKSLNLTRIREVEEACRFHYCESLFL